MGYTHASITLANPRFPELRSVQARALVDTGALMLCLPSEIAEQLQLSQNDTRSISIADGSVHKVPYMGPVQINFDNRVCYVGALVFGNEVLLGAVPMKDMDLLVCPKDQKLIVNPAHPNFAHSLVK